MTIIVSADARPLFAHTVGLDVRAADDVKIAGNARPPDRRDRVRYFYTERTATADREIMDETIGFVTR